MIFCLNIGTCYNQAVWGGVCGVVVVGSGRACLVNMLLVGNKLNDKKIVLPHGHPLVHRHPGTSP